MTNDCVGKLQTRFYNPQWRRFINADTFFIAGEDGLSALTAANMFAYANGNPVMMVDPDGRFAILGISIWIWLAGAIAAIAALTATIAVVAGFFNERSFLQNWGRAFLFVGIPVLVVIALVAVAVIFLAPIIGVDVGDLRPRDVWDWIRGLFDRPSDDDPPPPPPPPPPGGAVQCPPLADVRRGTAAQYLAMGIGYFIQAPVNNANFISSRFGPRDGAWHLGIDITTGTAGQIKNRTLIAVTSGHVVDISTDRTASQGYSISFRSDTLRDPETYHFLIFTYMHMQNAPTLERGEWVARGAVLGQVGNSPNPEFRPDGTLGPNYHLHFEVSNSGDTWGPNGCCQAERRWWRVQYRVNPIFFYPVGTFRGTTTVWNEVRGRSRNCNCP